MKLILIFSALILVLQYPSSVLAAGDDNSPIRIKTEKQQTIRPSYPFPSFLSTGPYIWYENTEKTPIKGHAFRISTFSEKNTYQVYIEKVQFGRDGCCLEIIDYKKLLIDAEILKQFFPDYTGKHGFKLIRWISPEVFEFNAYGGNYRLRNISSDLPVIEDLNAK